MATLTIGLGAACCLAGAVAHLRDATRGREDLFGSAGFVLLLAGMVLTRA